VALQFLPLRAKAYCPALSPPVFRTVNYTILQESSVCFRSIFPGHEHFNHIDINIYATVFWVVDTKVALKLLSLKMDAACSSETVVSTSETTVDRSEHELQFLCANLSVILREEVYWRREVTAEKNVFK
jgi:hypothetical protein